MASSETRPEGFAERLPDGRIRCLACQRGCVLATGDLGLCRTRQNQDGKLVPLSYGRVAALHPAQVERKPLYHFYPGRVMLSAGGLGCNFRCPGCQNRDLSFADVPDALTGIPRLSPEELVRRASEQGLLGISWTYNEPAVWFEYTLDGARLAKATGLKTNYVTNGSLTGEALDEIGPYLDAYRVDIKGFSADTYQRVANFPNYEGILDVAERARHTWDMHVECVTNIIPTVNDAEDELRGIAGWIATALGPDTPWHVTRFAPHGDLAHLPRTPLETLECAREIGLQEGLLFVYLGNVPGHRAENTWCPDCGTLLIERTRLGQVHCRLEAGACPECGCGILGRFD
ncbi:MAG: AmmeMemoRadiSam system radical SAM enzyme [Candidatus Brocadiaceae bacterium]|jgi:pyruvate formate lyase activating enzyme